MLMSKSRLEKFLYALYSLDSGDLPTPLSRIEELYKCLVTGDEAPTFEPLSRVEKYLMAILGVYDVELLPNPLSRVEVLLHKLATGDDNLDDVKSFLSEHEELLAEIIRNGGAGGNTDIEYVLYTLSTEFNTLYNTAKKPIKSAILKGNTMVNLWVQEQTTTTIEPSVWLSTFVSSTIKRSTKYILKYKVKQGNLSERLMLQFYKNNTWVVNEQTYINLDKQYFIFTSTSSDFNKLRVFYHYSFGTETVVLDDIMLIEYQEGMENWDIPYFEGMKSVQMPVLTTSNEDGTKTNILTVNEDVELRGIGDVKDELNVLTGELTQRIETRVYQEGDESNSDVITDLTNTVYKLTTESVKTVDLSVVNQDGNDTKLSTFNDITHVTLSSEGLIPEAELEVATKNEEVLNTMSLEMDDISTSQNTLKETTDIQSENVDATMIATTEIYEGLL